MNQAVGTICAGFDANSGHSGPPNLAANGPWMDGNHSHRRDRPYKTFGKATSFTGVSPAGIWLTLDEDPYSVNDANFSMVMVSAQWLDWPATYHDMGGSLTFCDGHVEIHRWLDPRTKVLNGSVTLSLVPGSVDWLWLSERTSFQVH